MISLEKEKSGITRIGIGAQLKPECESIMSSTLISRTCEVCGKKHDGTYGSGRFCSFQCKQKYTSTFGGKATALKLKEAGIKCHCEFCGEQFTARKYLKAHLPKCDKRVYKARGCHSSKIWSCKYCNNVFQTRKSMFEHYKQCREYLKLPKDSLGRVIGDYDRSTVAKRTVQKLRLEGRKFGHSHTDETKKHLSERRRQNLENGIGNHWICPSIKRSYAEEYFYKCFKNANIEIENNIWVGHYCLDFKVNNNYFEVDGEQHYTEEGLAKDARRTEYLNKQGLHLVSRCRWRDFKKLSFEDKEAYVNFVIKELLKEN